MRKLSAVLFAVSLSFAAFIGSTTTSIARAPAVDARAYLAEHGYLPIHGADTLARAKAWADTSVARAHGLTATTPTSASAPSRGPAWNGLTESDLAPPDPNGAIGPMSYIEIINLQIGIYTRAGAKVSSTKLQVLTGHSNLSDPMILWDPDTQRFYYNVWDTSANTMEWGFSKSNNPKVLPTDFCNFTASFGYLPGQFTDYPKLGQTEGFLDIGINFYPSSSSLHATQSDLLWITKPQGSAALTTCPVAASFTSGKFANLRNQDGSQAFTPVPAIQTDPSNTGYISAMSDIECPDICGSGSTITVYSLTPSANPKIPVLSAPKSVKVTSFSSPPSAPQKGTSSKLDTLDGRLTHSVSGIDPTSNKTAIWLAHTVLGGAGSQIQWFEIDAASSPLALLQSGFVTNPHLYVLNAGISNDRTVPATGAPSHGSAMVLGFTTTSSTTFPADQMVSKIGAGAQSGFVLVKQSPKFYKDFSCTPGPCRWGDYGGATPDPAASTTAANGNVWLSNEWDNNTVWLTFNWEAHP